jgi:hypothetical protein
MRTLTAVIVSLVLITSSVSVAAASRTQSGSGLLVGLTQISYGCPGPARVGQPPCERWHAFPHARFAIRQIGPKGQPLPQIIRVVVSDHLGHFSVRLSTGDYHTAGSTSHVGRAEAGNPRPIRQHDQDPRSLPRHPENGLIRLGTNGSYRATT